LNTAGSYEDYEISPVVGTDGTIYLYQGHEAPDGHVRLKAISATTHTTLWTWSGVGGALSTTPAVAPDGVVYVITDLRNQDLIAIKNGKTLWTRAGLYLNGGSPTIGPDGTVYVEGSNSELYAVSPQNG